MSDGIIASVIAGLAVRIALIFLLSMAVEKSPQVSGETTMTVKAACLPHKKSLLVGGVETSECAEGFLRIDNGKYYGLQIDDQKYYWLGSTKGLDELLTVTRIIRPTHDSDHYETYEIAGVIDNISSAGTADGHTSIYEVAYAPSKELTAILDKIYAKTGGGYSMGVDKRCDNDSSDNHSYPCIKITLEKDAPELRKQIPDQLEGFKVDVQILNR